MRLKSYFAATVGAAMAKAAQELGPEAMLVHSKESTPETRQLGKYEVVFASPKPAPAPKPSPRPGPPPESDGALALVAGVERQLAELRRRLASGVGEPPAEPRKPCFSDDVEAAFWFERLCQTGLDADHAGHIVERARTLDPKRPIADGVRRALQKWIPIEPAPGANSPAPSRSPAPARALAFVGPPGAGKTMTLIKVAAQHGMFLGRPLRLISLDAMRVGCGMVRADLLRAYAGILGAQFSLAESVHALARRLGGPADPRLTLIDTPGWPPAQIGEGRLLAGFLAQRSDIDVHLVLPADMSAAALAAAAERFALFRPGKLILTRLDEASSIGAACSLAARRRMSLSFLADGQSVQENLRPATCAEIVRRLAPGAAGNKPPRRPEAA